MLVDPSLSGLCGIKGPIKKDLECASFSTYVCEQHKKTMCASYWSRQGDQMHIARRLSSKQKIVEFCCKYSMSNLVSNSRWRRFIFPKYSWFTFIFLPLCVGTPHALNFNATLCRQASCISLQRYLIITPSILQDRRWPCLTSFWDNGQTLGRAFHPPQTIKSGQRWLHFSVRHRNPCKYCCQEDIYSERYCVGYRRTEDLSAPLCLGGSHQCIC